MSRPPRVSVLIPCFDLGRFLDEAVDSVFAQSCQDFEILIVDDGSTDPETVRLLAGYQRPKAVVLAAAHGGLAAARNLALGRARGEFVCALDADDRLDPRFLEATLAAFDADPGLTFCSAWQRAFGEAEWVWRQERCDLAALLAENTVLPAALVRRDAVVAAGGWDTAMPSSGYEDWDLWLSLVELGHRGTILPEVLFHYRQRSDSMSAGIYARPEVHRELMRYLYAKHEVSYSRHLWEVYDLMQGRGAEVLRRTYDLERRLATWLEPQAAGLRAELARLDARIAAAGGLPPPRPVRAASKAPAALASEQAAAARLADLESALAAARHEAAALRASASWRVTAPLRATYDWLLRLRGER